MVSNLLQPVDILVFGPHPDDAELGAAGIIARHVRLGYRVGVVDLTRGELATNGTPEERQEEARRAAEILRLTFRHNLGFPDRHIRSTQENVGTLVKVLRITAPKAVLAPWWGDPHPDHVAAASLLEEACYSAGLNKYLPEVPALGTFQLFFYFINNVPVEPLILIDVTGDYGIKQQALAAHASQFIRAASETDTPPGLVGSAKKKRLPTGLNHPSYLRGIESRDRYLGSLLGTQFAEGLITRRHILAGSDLVKGFVRVVG